MPKRLKRYGTDPTSKIFTSTSGPNTSLSVWCCRRRNRAYCAATMTTPPIRERPVAIQKKPDFPVHTNWSGLRVAITNRVVPNSMESPRAAVSQAGNRAALPRTSCSTREGPIAWANTDPKRPPIAKAAYRSPAIVFPANSKIRSRNTYTARPVIAVDPTCGRSRNHILATTGLKHACARTKLKLSQSGEVAHTNMANWGAGKLPSSQPMTAKVRTV